MLFRLFASALCALLVSPAIARPVDYPQSLARRAASQTHRVVTYMAYYHVDQNTGPYTPLLPIVDDHSNITDVVLFSVDLHTNQPNLTIGGVAPDNSTFLGPLWSEVTKIQAGGIKVLASLGGYGSDSFILLENDFDGYYALLKQFLQYYKLDGLDIDVEPSTDSTYSGTPSGASIVKLLKQVDQDFGSDFLVTMVPVADDLAANPPDYSGFDYKTVDNEAKDADGNHIIDWLVSSFASDSADLRAGSMDRQVGALKRAIAHRCPVLQRIW